MRISRMAKLYKLKKFQKQLKKCRVSQRYEFFFTNIRFFIFIRHFGIFAKEIWSSWKKRDRGRPAKFPVNIQNTYNIWLSFLISWLILSKKNPFKKKILNFHLTFRNFCKGNYPNSTTCVVSTFSTDFLTV